MPVLFILFNIIYLFDIYNSVLTIYDHLLHEFSHFTFCCRLFVNFCSDSILIVRYISEAYNNNTYDFLSYCYSIYHVYVDYGLPDIKNSF